MEDNIKKLSDFLVERANKEWSEKNQDYHLARVDSEFKELFKEDYRDYLGKYEKISEFARNVPGIHVNQDPKARAKIGIRPEDKKDVVDQEPAGIEPAKRRPVNYAYSPEERSLIQFLRLLSNLPDEELQKISIPVSVLAKITRK